jgi:Uma2 family endonuclease
MEPITDISQLDVNKRYTYADYLTWQFNERVELIKGGLHKMSLAPRRLHQKIEGILHVKLWLFFENRTCEVYQSPFDVRLSKNKGQIDQKIDTVVQPDICVICDKSKLDDAGCIGAPDLIVEILSDSTAKKDYNEKFNLYEENEVKEYWIVNPATKTIEIFSLVENKYVSLGLFNEQEGATTVEGHLFPELSIELKTIFSE